jgi:arabinose-5-phosphate isomerase
MIIQIDEQTGLEQSAEWLRAARDVLEVEAQSILSASERLDGNLTQAVRIILNASHSSENGGKIVVSGIGKSGHVGQKIAATLCSTGTPAVFLHAAEATHGDLGVYSPGDPTILISKSGSTGELVRLVPILRQFHSPLIAIVGNLNSPLATEADVVLDGRVAREADPLDIVPTASAVVALALGDALAAALMVARRFTHQDYHRFHPSGQLGRNLGLRVADVMHRGMRVAWVSLDTSLRDVVIRMTEHPLGAACVVDEAFQLLGLITDGDVRRALQKYEDIRPLCARDVMTVQPISVTQEVMLKDAAALMENRASQISVLPVRDNPDGPCIGLVRIHDIYQANIT